MKHLAKLALAALTALALTGCMGHDPNMAVSINGTSYTESDITALKAGIETITDGTAIPASQVVELLIATQIVQDALEKAGTPFPTSIVESLFGTDENYAKLKAVPDIPPDFADDFGTYQILMNANSFYSYFSDQISVEQMNTMFAAIQDESASATIEVNPKYGTYSPEQFGLDGTNGSLSQEYGAAVTAE